MMAALGWMVWLGVTLLLTVAGSISLLASASIQRRYLKEIVLYRWGVGLTLFLMWWGAFEWYPF
ncbi:TMhelix containing protein [Vibrio phage 1.170.O._10N.261.52.C3]|nr:TMhelix containing protein [Vibrio phage 1.170.O._10N.261.52.C3]